MGHQAGVDQNPIVQIDASETGTPNDTTPGFKRAAKS
jgi:hypothetical protein